MDPGHQYFLPLANQIKPGTINNNGYRGQDNEEEEENAVWVSIKLPSSLWPQQHLAQLQQQQHSTLFCREVLSRFLQANESFEWQWNHGKSISINPAEVHHRIDYPASGAVHLNPSAKKRTQQEESLNIHRPNNYLHGQQQSSALMSKSQSQVSGRGQGMEMHFIRHHRILFIAPFI